MKPQITVAASYALMRMARTIELLKIKDDFWSDIIFSDFFYRAEQA
jgi:hypothetical protein